MCNVTKKTNKDTVTIYKAVIKDGKNYYALFSGVKIKVGTVKPQTLADYNRLEMRFMSCGWLYNTFCAFHNKNMVGKTSGFATLKSAKLLVADTYSSRVVLKMVLGGEIWRGTAKNITNSVPYSKIVYAGSKILSFEEVK